MLWKKNPDAYRRHYYDGEETFETAETKFGKMVAEWLESDDPCVKHIPNYSVREYEIDVIIDGNKVFGKVDGFDPVRIRFLDHKSSHKDKNGKVPWDKIKVRKHEQLPFYSMCLKEIFGKVESACHIIWIETEFKENTIEFDGHILKAQGRELQLTGKVKKFRREIREWERKRIREDLLKVCNQIKQDYADYTRSKEVHVGVGEVKPQEVATK